MIAERADAIRGMTRTLERLAPLSAADRSALADLPLRIETIRNRSYLFRDGDGAADCCLLVEGFACRHKFTDSGGRQIVSFHIAGDILGLEHLWLSRADHNAQTVTDATIGRIAATALKELVDQSPAIADALSRAQLIDASIYREWVLNVGRRDARSRVMHMLCEFAARAQFAGLGGREGLDLPMTQEEIADATGLTPVHVNRVLRALEHDGILGRAARRLFHIADWRRAWKMAGFDPGYLHLRPSGA